MLSSIEYLTIYRRHSNNIIKCLSFPCIGKRGKDVSKYFDLDSKEEKAVPTPPKTPPKKPRQSTNNHSPKVQTNANVAIAKGASREPAASTPRRPSEYGKLRKVTPHKKSQTSKVSRAAGKKKKSNVQDEGNEDEQQDDVIPRNPYSRGSKSSVRKELFKSDSSEKGDEPDPSTFDDEDEEGVEQDLSIIPNSGTDYFPAAVTLGDGSMIVFKDGSKHARTILGKNKWSKPVEILKSPDLKILQRLADKTNKALERQADTFGEIPNIIANRVIAELLPKNTTKSAGYPKPRASPGKSTTHSAKSTKKSPTDRAEKNKSHPGNNHANNSTQVLVPPPPKKAKMEPTIDSILAMKAQQGNSVLHIWIATPPDIWRTGKQVVFFDLRLNDVTYWTFKPDIVQQLCDANRLTRGFVDTAILDNIFVKDRRDPKADSSQQLVIKTKKGLDIGQQILGFLFPSKHGIEIVKKHVRSIVHIMLSKQFKEQYVKFKINQFSGTDQYFLDAINPQTGKMWAILKASLHNLNVIEISHLDEVITLNDAQEVAQTLFKVHNSDTVEWANEFASATFGSPAANQDDEPYEDTIEGEDTFDSQYSFEDNDE